METVKWLFGLAIPSSAAAFVWLMNIARKDPTLFKLIDKRLTAWTNEALFAVVAIGISTFLLNWNKDEGKAIFFMLFFGAIYALTRFHRSLEFLREVAGLDSPADQ